MSSINANSPTLVNYAAVAEMTVKPVQAEPNAVKVVAETKPVVNISDTELEEAVDVLNQALALDQRSLSFSIDDASGRSVIKVVDYETEELIKQIPTEELLKVSQNIKRLQEEMGQSIGLLIDNKV
ncbi:flagellar protein FlaG [Rheinheimera metallidurans]|uniref:flagellar protein FlaG n=1 Tax=Rheinheimera metallidurans TaxID=2925781 RepID=UPI003001892E